jgi:hypothetical protein
MLVTLQFPFADLRPFVDATTHRLLTPDWPTPRSGVDFVRLLGQVAERPFGGVKEWPGEHIFCNAARAIRFTSTFSKTTTRGSRYGAARSFYCDGDGLARIEVGVEFRGKQPLTLNELLATIHDVAALPVAVGRAGQLVKTELFGAGQALAKLMLHATTSRKAGAEFQPSAWWLVACQSMMMIEYDADREPLPALPEYRKLTHPKIVSTALDYGRMSMFGRSVGVWLFGFRSATNAQDTQRLKIHIRRLHAQREVVKEVLRAIHTERISITRTTKEDGPEVPSNRLQRFLSETISRMERQEYSGMPQSELLQAAEEIQDSVTEGELTAIRLRLQPLRRSVLTAVEKFSKDRGSVETMIVVEEGGQFVMSQNQQNVNVSGTGNTLGDVTQIVGSTITNSLNRVKQSDAPDDLKAKLLDLGKLVEQLVAKAPPEAQEQAAKSLDVLTKEATSKKPDRRWYEVSGEGLIEAAKTVADMAAPITTAVKAVLALL